MAPPRSRKKGEASGKGKAPVTTSAQADLPHAILQVIPDPIATLKLGEPEEMAKSYENCITDIIESIRKESGKGFTFRVEGDSERRLDRFIPMTPGVDESPNGAYTVAITDGTKTLRLVAQKYQTWFRGFETNAGNRYEIDDMYPKMLVGSRSLYTRSRYNEMLGNTADKCRIGYDLITNAFHTLVDHPDSTGDSEVAIAIILVMLYEAPRFPGVYQKCLQLIRERKNGFVGGSLQPLINGWCRKCLDFYEENGQRDPVVLTDETSTVIKEIAQEFSILCRSAWDKWLEEKSQDQEEDTRGGAGSKRKKKIVGASGSSHSK